MAVGVGSAVEAMAGYRSIYLVSRERRGKCNAAAVRVLTSEGQAGINADLQRLRMKTVWGRGEARSDAVGATCLKLKSQAAKPHLEKPKSRFQGHVQSTSVIQARVRASRCRWRCPSRSGAVGSELAPINVDARSGFQHRARAE